MRDFPFFIPPHFLKPKVRPLVDGRPTPLGRIEYRPPAESDAFHYELMPGL